MQRGARDYNPVGSIRPCPRHLSVPVGPPVAARAGLSPAAALQLLHPLASLVQPRSLAASPLANFSHTGGKQATASLGGSSQRGGG